MYGLWKSVLPFYFEYFEEHNHLLDGQEGRKPGTSQIASICIIFY